MRRVTLKNVAALAVIAVTLGAPVAAQAAPRKTDGSAKAKFYDMNETLFDGRSFKPQTMAVQVRRGVKFERMFSLKKPQFFKKSFATAKLPVFR